MVATAAAHTGRGSDSGGSVRIRAASNGSVGFKNTARLAPTADAVALLATLDTVSALTRSVTDAIVAHEDLAARVITKSVAPLRTCRLAVPRTTKPDGPDATVARAWQRALEQVRTHGVQVQEIDVAELAELPSINASGGLSAAESYPCHRRRLHRYAASCDPRVAAGLVGVHP